jgi:hypothetical protein
LLCKIKNNEIYKPKFQRKRKWNILPDKKDNAPSEKKYIQFLYDTHHSVHPITFGVISGLNSNIDGNNRINALAHFMDKPFEIFLEYLLEIIHFIDKNFTDVDIISKIQTGFKTINYDTLMSFKYNKDFFNNKFAFDNDFYDKWLKLKRDEFEDLIECLQKKLKINGEDRFDTTVHVSANLFEGYSTEELCKTFEDINKYNSNFPEIELLASRLHTNTNFTINNKTVNCEIIDHIKTFYMERAKNETLSCYIYGENDKMNAYDFMVGFQYYAHNKCLIIEEPNNDGLSLFFKVYKTLYKGSFDETLNSVNINDFVDKILKVINLLQSLCTNVFAENLTGSKIFDACNKKVNTLKKNNIYLIICSIVGYINQNTPSIEILKSIEKCIFYHFFVGDISSKENKDIFKVHDSIIYEAGGTYIDNMAGQMYKTPSTISDKITESLMMDVITVLIKESIKNKPYEVRSNGKDKNDKRRNRKFFEKALFYIFYTNKVPTEFLKHTFWVEHICPFSSEWCDQQLDIDRLGNIVPIIDNLNSKRNNKHISEYTKHDKSHFIEFVKDLIPTYDVYDTICSHSQKKPNIISCDEYNNRCASNEDVYRDVFIKHLFN